MYNGVIIEALIREDIINAVSNFEPRVTITDSDIIIEQDVRTVNIYIQYTIKETGEINNFNLELTAEDNPYR